MSRRPAKSTRDTKNPWIASIERAKKALGLDKWDASCREIQKQYRYDNSVASKVRRYQMLWANVEVMKGATYAKPPKAEVARRYSDKDPTARQATLMVERCINTTFDLSNYDEKFKQVRDDFLLYARGQARIVYEPVMGAMDASPGDAAPEPEPDDDAQLLDDAEEQDADSGEAAGVDDPAEILKFEHVRIKFLQRNDFVHGPARVWDEVPWVSFRAYLNRGELRKRFTGKTEDGRAIADLIPLNQKGVNDDKQAGADDGGEDKAEIWEVWDKDGNRVLWVAREWPDILEEGEPYLKLDGFYPCPRPAYGTLTTDCLTPRPDYVYYQDQAEEINTLTARISSLQESLKLVGFYPAGPDGEGEPAIEQAVKPGFENKMIAVKSAAMFAEGGKSGPPIVWLPMEQVITVLEGCVKLRTQLIEDVFQITGISDIVRGATDPNETKGAQVLKSQHGSVRMATRQTELARFCRDITRLVGEVICNHFQPETIMEMANLPLPTDEDVLRQLEAQRLQMQQQAAAQAMAQHQAQIAAINAQGSPQGGPQPAPGAMPPPGPPQPPMGMHA